MNARRGALLLALVSCAVLTSGVFSSSEVPAVPASPSADEVRLRSYCGAPVHGGAEGTLGPGLRGAAATLVQVQLAVRHGDRSTIHDVPGHDDARWDCDMDARLTSGERWRDAVAGFRVTNLDDGRSEAAKLQSKTTTTTTATDCAKGQLTARGLQQHVDLGAALRKRYGAFLEQTKPDDVRARSTYYTRTVQSAAGLLTGLLGGGAAARQVTIWTTPDEAREPMKGIGLAAGAPELLCPRAQQDFDAARAAEAALTGALMGSLAREFGVEHDPEWRDWQVTDITEALYARACHLQPLPCSAERANELIAMSDAVYGLRANSAGLRMVPLLQELLANAERQAPRVAVFAGHDTVVAPLLAALGAFDDVWPPYASHVAFETWVTGDGPAVRVVYNGVEVTQRIPACRNQALCPLRLFAEAVKGPLRGAGATLEEACAVEG